MVARLFIIFNSGVPGEIIQLFGNWASDCYRFTRESLLDAAYIVSRSVPRFLFGRFFGGFEAARRVFMLIYVFVDYNYMYIFSYARSLHLTKLYVFNYFILIVISPSF